MPRSLEPDLPKPEEAPLSRVPDDYELTVVEEPGTPSASAGTENEKNPLMEIVEQGMDAAGGNAVERKVPHKERSTVGTLGPSIH